mgnify:CR=1 FL=1
MAPPLLPITRLVICSACAEHVKSSEDVCPHCGAVLGTRHGLLARAAGVALAGMMIASCNDGKDTTTSTTEGASSGGSTSGSSSGSSTGSSSGTTTGVSETFDSQGEAAYGVPTTDFTTLPPDTDGPSTTADTSGSGSSGDTDTGTSTMTGGPEYGVPDTSGGPEPDYGVPGTGTSTG